jgi:hypothetical protein
MPENAICDASRGSSVTRKIRVTVFASQIRVHQSRKYASLIKKICDAYLQHVSWITVIRATDKKESVTRV